MPSHSIEIQIDERYVGRTPSEALRQVAAATLVHDKVEPSCGLAVVVTDDEMLQELNHRHLGVDAPTDVLAFPSATSGRLVDAPGQPSYLGDVVISYPRARALAGDLGHDVLAELQLLVVHGVLHLLGYDDTLDAKRGRMLAVQAKILRSLKIEVDLPE